MKTLGFKVDDKEFDALKKFAKEQGKTMSEVVRQRYKNNLSAERLAERIEALEKTSGENLKYLKRVLYESTRSNIAIEELAERLIQRSDHREEFKESVKKKMEELRYQTGG